MLHQFFVLILTILFMGCATKDQEMIKPVKSPVLFGDPFVLNCDTIFYLYGTHGENGIEVYKSKDLLFWSGPCGATNGLALHKNDVWGDKWYWAPEVYEVNGKFYMFFSVDEHIAVATSNSPTGPFTQVKKEILIAENKAIDNHLFIDDSTKYIYYVNFQFGGLEIYYAEMEDDLLAIKEGSAVECISRSQEWEFDEGNVNEGPFILKNDSYYYLIYSGNGYTSQNYGLGFAVSKSPKGQWIKHPENPFLQKPGDLVGVGHCSFFYGNDGTLKIVYHSHYNKQNIHPRKVHINDVRFVEDENFEYKVLEVDTSDLSPLFKIN